MKCLPLVPITLILCISFLAGCQTGQSPMIPTQKNPDQPVIIRGNGNKVKIKIKQKWRTDVWLGGSISNKQDQDNKLDVEIPLIP